MSPAEPALSQLRLPPGQSLDDWNEAYGKVESYLASLRVRNKFLMGHHVSRILDRAKLRAAREPERKPTALAMEEAVKLVNDWCGQVLSLNVADTPHRIATQSRLAMMLADVTGKWQEVFLTPGPWPEDFIREMKASYLRSGPDFQISQMAPRPIDLGPIHTITTIGKRPYLKMIVLWIIMLGLLVAIFLRLHPKDGRRSEVPTGSRALPQLAMARPAPGTFF